MKIKKDNLFKFGVDWMDVLGTSEKIEEINFGLSVDKYIESELFPGYKVRLVTKVMNYAYKIILQKNGFDCFAYHKGMQQGVIDTKDFIAVYGIAFRIFNDLEEIMEFLVDNIEYTGLRRFDVALDITEDIRDVHKKFKKNKGKGSIFFDVKGDVQTFYIGEKQKGLNKRQLIRCYNKIDAIKLKSQQFLYAEYLTQEHITRIEIEFRAELCTNIELLQLLDTEFLYDIFLSYIKKHTDIFSRIKFDKKVLSSTRKRVSIEDLKYDEILKTRYVNIFMGYAKTIREIGGCPVDILLRRGSISEDTMKDIVLSIKDGEFRQDIYEFGLGVRNSRYIFRDKDDGIEYLPNHDFYEGGDKL